ncbi:MAG TPA: hypothetical protein VKK61_03430 [Tepidisphaeraceae bacterium]|nr:hypothetical protein [Tepidisphaeraceae bacterium]
MTYRGKVMGGVVVLPTGASLPDGTEVNVAPIEPASQGVADDSLWRRLSELGRSTESKPTNLPTDLAANHDHYLHDLPKRA